MQRAVKPGPSDLLGCQAPRQTCCSRSPNHGEQSWARWRGSSLDKGCHSRFSKILLPSCIEAVARRHQEKPEGDAFLSNGLGSSRLGQASSSCRSPHAAPQSFGVGIQQRDLGEGVVPGTVGCRGRHLGQQRRGFRGGRRDRAFTSSEQAHIQRWLEPRLDKLARLWPMGKGKSAPWGQPSAWRPKGKGQGKPDGGKDKGKGKWGKEKKGKVPA